MTIAQSFKIELYLSTAYIWGMCLLSFSWIYLQMSSFFQGYYDLEMSSGISKPWYCFSKENIMLHLPSSHLQCGFQMLPSLNSLTVA